MPRGLVRHRQSGCFHLSPFGCYRRLRRPDTVAARALFERTLENMRIRYDFAVCGYLVLPDRVYLPVSEPGLPFI